MRFARAVLFVLVFILRFGNRRRVRVHTGKELTWRINFVKIIFTVREDFSIRLKKAIADSPLKQTEIADKCGITAPYLSDLKTGKKANPSREVVEKLAQILCVPVAWLMLLDDSVNPSENNSPAESYGNPNFSQPHDWKFNDESIVRDEARPQSADPLREETLRKSRERFEKRDEIGSRKLEAVLGEIRERLEDALHSPPHHTETLFAECRTRLDELQNWVVMLKAKPETHT
jgi:transcriptional regulator with XRE-family HTH domain